MGRTIIRALLALLAAGIITVNLKVEQTNNYQTNKFQTKNK